jgi:hypothetical protein
MEVLNLCEDMFGSVPSKTSIKGFFKDKAAEIGNPIEAFHKMCYWLGGRGYNQYLDYGLFTLKFIKICRMGQFSFSIENWKPFREVISSLLDDDRHDMYQNVPIHIKNIGKQLNDEKQMHFYEVLLTALIECVNVSGTEDQAYKITIKEE